MKRNEIRIRRFPIWLKGLGKVKKELVSEHWPGAEEGFEQGIALMALGLKALAGRRQDSLLAVFSKGSTGWVKRWKKERAKALFHSTYARS